MVGIREELGRHIPDSHGPPGTLHEAFFDPVDIGTAVGADSSDGVLKPAAFTVGGANTTISSLKWEAGTATMALSPSASLSGYAIDFIALDGSVSLTLSFDDATQSGGTLTWSVGEPAVERRRPAHAAHPDPAPRPLRRPLHAYAHAPYHVHAHTDAYAHLDRYAYAYTHADTDAYAHLTATPTHTYDDRAEPITVTLIPRVDGLGPSST